MWYVKHAVRHFLFQKGCTSAILISWKFPTPGLSCRLGVTAACTAESDVQTYPTVGICSHYGGTHSKPPLDKDVGKENGKEGTLLRNQELQFVRVLQWFVSSQNFFPLPLWFSYNSCDLCGAQGKDIDFISFWTVSGIHCCPRHTDIYNVSLWSHFTHGERKVWKSIYVHAVTL